MPKHMCCGVATATDDDELEKRLAKIRQAKGATPDGEGVKEQRRRTGTGTGIKPATDEPKPKPAAEKKTYDFSDEVVYYEGPPHRADLAINLALGTTLLWLPLTAAAIGRSAFISYRFTNKRVSVQTTAPWKTEQTDVAYQEVKDVVVVSRLLGAYGDMVITLKDNSKLEFRSLDRFKELKNYVLERRDALGGGPPKEPSIMNLDDDDDDSTVQKTSGSKKGFA
eukprot:jgi/Chrzof1/1542/Cz10g11220.t1